MTNAQVFVTAIIPMLKRPSAQYLKEGRQQQQKRIAQLGWIMCVYHDSGLYNHWRNFSIQMSVDLRNCIVPQALKFSVDCCCGINNLELSVRIKGAPMWLGATIVRWSAFFLQQSVKVKRPGEFSKSLSAKWKISQCTHCGLQIKHHWGAEESKFLFNILCALHM